MVLFGERCPLHSIEWGRMALPAMEEAVATIVNLNKYRKKRGRVEQERRAAENRIRFGRSKQERSKDALESARAEKEIEDKRLE